MPAIGAAISVIAGAIGGAVTAIGATAVGSFFLRLGATVALSALARALAPTPRDPGIQTQSTQTGGINPLSFVLGTYATAGTLVAPPLTHGGNHSYLTYVIALGAAPGQTLGRVAVNDEWVDLDVDNANIDYGFTAEAGSKYAGKLWVKFHDGSQSTADPMLLAQYGNHPDYPWASPMVGQGIAYAICTFVYDRTLYSGLPKVLFELGGIPLYDIRKDDTAGGTGAHRQSDRSTWEQSDNPVVMIYNILRGIPVGAETWGGGVDADDLPFDSWVAAMTQAEAPVSLLSGGTEPAYRAGFEVRVDEEPLGVIDELLKACSGDLSNTGGAWKLRIGAAALPVLMISDDDIIITEDQQLNPFPGLDATFNGVTAHYPEPVSLYQSREAPPRSNALWESDDGNRRLVADLSLPAVPHANQVQRLMRALIEDERRFIRHTITLPPMAIQLEPLDTIAWTSARNGYVAKLFEVAAVTVDPMTLLHRVTMRERDAADYAWVPGFELPSNPATPGLTAPVLTLSGFAAAAATIRDGGGIDRRAAIKITWDGDQPLATGLEWELRIAGGLTITTGTLSDVERGAHIITRGIVRNSAYEVRARLVAPIPAGWTGWVAIGSLDVRIQPDDLADALTVPGVPANLHLSSVLLSDARASVAAAWTAGTNAVAYEVGVTRSGGAEVVLTAGDTSFELETVAAAAFTLRVRSISATGTKSPWTASGTIVAATDTTAPAAPTGLTATTGFGTYWLEWEANTETDLSHYRIRQRIGANDTSSQKYYTTTGTGFAITGAPAGEISWFRIHALDSSGNQSALSAATDPAFVTVPSGVTSADVSGIIDATSFAAGMTGVEVVAALPATGNFDGRTAVLTTDGKLYRHTGGAWTSAVPSADIAGQLTNAQIAGIEAAKVSGQLTNAQIAGIAASKLTGQVVAAQIADGAVGTAKFASGLTPVEIVSTLPSTGNFEGRQAMLTTDGKLYRYVSGAWTSAVTATDITGQVQAAQIAALEASKVTGQLTDTQIADLSTAKLSGQITQTQITDNSISTGKIAASAIVADKIASSAITGAKIAANAITAGKLQAGVIDASKIAANAITAGKIAASAVTANEIAAGTITASEIASDAITAAKIQAGAVSASEIATGAITASKVAIGDFTNLNPDRDYKDEALWSGASGFYATAIPQWKSTRVMRIIGTSDAYVFVYGPHFNVTEGEELLVTSISMVEAGTGAASLNLEFAQYEDMSSSTHIWATPSVGTTSASISEKTGTIIVPGNMKWARIRAYKVNDGATEVRFGAITIRRKTTGELIVDGAITAGKIAANTITAAQIATGAITATEIAANAVTAAKVAAGAITAGKIAANAVTANEIAAGAITATELAANAVTAGKIAAGAVSADQIAAKAIVSSRLAVTDFTNLNADDNFDDPAYWYVTGAGQSMVFTNTTNTSGWGGTRYVKLSGPAGTYCVVYGPTLTVDPLGEELWLRYFAKVQTGGGFTYVDVEHAENAAFTINKSFKSLGTVTSPSIVEKKGNIVLPAGSRFIRLRMIKGNTTTTESRIGGIQLRRKGRGELIVDGAITADHLTTSGAVITGTAQIKNAIITNAKIADLSAAKLTAGTALAGSLTVSGTALSSVESRADDPAARINAKATLIDPGRITISGATTLSDWRKGGDLTKIDGGNISANTVSANKLEIGSRNITLTGIEFEHNDPATNKVSWTAGSVRYINDAGSPTSVSVAAGSATWSSGILYICWTKDATALSTTTSQAAAFAASNVILATYQGGTRLDVDFGRTIIDGAKIKTGTIDAARLNVTDLSAISANLGSISVTDANIANLSVGTEKITGNAVTKVRIATATGAPSISFMPSVSGELTCFLFASLATSGVGAMTYTRTLRIAGTSRGSVSCSRGDLSPGTSSAANASMVCYKVATTGGTAITVDVTASGSGSTSDLVLIAFETKR